MPEGHLSSWKCYTDCQFLLGNKGAWSLVHSSLGGTNTLSVICHHMGSLPRSTNLHWSSSLLQVEVFLFLEMGSRGQDSSWSRAGCWSKMEAVDLHEVCYSHLNYTCNHLSRSVPGVLWSMGSRRVGHYWTTEQQQQQQVLITWALLPLVLTQSLILSNSWKWK